VGQPSLRGVFAKLDRGDKHAECLKASIERFIDERPYRVVSEQDPETGDCLLRGEVLKRPPVHEWAVVLGDALFNFRSALDHLAWQLARVHHPDRDPPDRTEFPIFKDAELFEANRRSKIGGLGWEAQYLICQSQPCYRRNRPHLDWLWSLHELNRTDKHRELHLTGAIAKYVTFWTSRLTDLGVPEHLLAPVGAFDHREELSRIPGPLDIPYAEVANELQFGFDIALDPEGPAAGGNTVGLMLDMWSKTLRDEIVPQFGKFFAP